MTKLQVGSIVFFNHGKKLELPLSYSENRNSLNSKIKQSLFSREEAKFLSNLLEIEIREGESFNPKLYKKLTEQGFSIVRLMPKIKEGSILDESKIFTAIVSNKISKEDADNLLSYYREVEEKSDVDLQKQIYVFDNERYYYNEKTEKGNVHNEALKIFLDYKTGRLSDNDQRIMDRYLNFDMQDVFLSDTKDRVLSHNNEGVIIITSNGIIYTATKKKEQHKYEAIEMLEKDIGIKVENKEEEADKLARENNVVVIKIYKTDRNVLAIFCPEEMTQKQIDGLIRCMEDFNKINLNLQVEGKPSILTLVNGNKFLKTDIGEDANVEDVLQKMIEYEKSKKNKRMLGTSINWIATNVGSFTQHLEKLRKSIKLPTNEEPDGRE